MWVVKHQDTGPVSTLSVEILDESYSAPPPPEAKNSGIQAEDPTFLAVVAVAVFLLCAVCVVAYMYATSSSFDPSQLMGEKDPTRCVPLLYVTMYAPAYTLSC